MRPEDTGPLYTRIGIALDAALGPFDRPTLLYTDVDDGVIGVVVGEDRGNYVFYHRFPDEYLADLNDAILALWRAAPPKKRWVDMTYLIANGRFKAEHFYPETVDPDEYPEDRGRRLIAGVFGDKPAQCDPPSPSTDGYDFILKPT